ncbi:MAG: hypothetical protein GC189_13570 [Alphaproteobacteria bacterium]|nr:hypothetical protein [Alphaproteobacteria bacterium]
MLGLFKRKPDPRPLVVLHLHARLQPIHRGDVFEDPLDAWLRAEGLGEVCGAGTAFIPGEGVQSCDIELLLADVSEATLARVRAKAEALGAPAGSKLTLDNGAEHAIGAWRGLALHLNGTDLPDEVYAQCDLDELYDHLNAALGAAGKAMSHHDGETETSLYLYGASVPAMRAAIAPVLRDYPLCQRSRLEEFN